MDKIFSTNGGKWGKVKCFQDSSSQSMVSIEQLHQRCCSQLKMQVIGLYFRLLNKKLWGWGPEKCISLKWNKSFFFFFGYLFQFYVLKSGGNDDGARREIIHSNVVCDFEVPRCEFPKYWKQLEGREHWPWCLTDQAVITDAILGRRWSRTSQSNR